MSGRKPITLYGCGTQRCGVGLTENGPYVRYADHKALLDAERQRRLQAKQECDRLWTALQMTVLHVACCHFEAEHSCSYRSLCYLLDGSGRHYSGLTEAVKVAVGHDPLGEIPKDKREDAAHAAAEYLMNLVITGPSAWEE